MLAIQEKILEGIKKRTDEKELTEYMLKCCMKLMSQQFDDKTLNLKQCAEAVLNREEPEYALSLHFPQFNWFKLSSGLHIIAAPSGHGKTLFAMEYAKAAAAAEQSVLFLSLEMTHEDLGARILSEISELPMSQIASGSLSDVQKQLLRGMLTNYDFLEKVTVDKFGSLDWVKIYPRLWNKVLQLRPKLIIVDFIQMIHDSDSDDGRLSQVYSNIARELKLFADQTKSAVLVLSQMNREAVKEVEKSKWPGDVVPLRNSQVKESGGIVEAADSVQLVCIPERFMNCPPHLKGRFQVIVDKNRKFGELGISNLQIDMTCGRFVGGAGCNHRHNGSYD